MKKKILSLALALTMCLGLAVPTFAANADTSAELYTWISEDYPYVGTDLKYQARSLNQDYTFGEAENLVNTFWLVPTSEYYRVGVYQLAKGEEDEIVIGAYTDHDGDGVYDQRLFYLDLEKSEVGVLPIPENGAYQVSDPVKDTVNAVEIPGFDKQGNGNYAFSADRLHELFGDNTLIFFYSGQNYLGGVLLSKGAFDDVPGLGWYSDTVAWAADKGIAMGTGDGNFGPGHDCTQLQILTFLSRAAGNTNAADYDWVEEQMMIIKWAEEKGMIGEGFDSEKPCTRAEAINYIWQTFDKPSAAASSFTDMEGYNEDYIKAVNWASEKGVARGDGGGKFSPDSICNRAQIMTFLYRAYNN